jgi:hypothetical protein
MFKVKCATRAFKLPLDVYAQHVPESQRRAIEQTSKMAAERIANAPAAKAAAAAAKVN